MSDYTDINHDLYLKSSVDIVFILCAIMCK